MTAPHQWKARVQEVRSGGSTALHEAWVRGGLEVSAGFCPGGSWLSFTRSVRSPVGSAPPLNVSRKTWYLRALAVTCDCASSTGVASVTSCSSRVVSSSM